MARTYRTRRHHVKGYDEIVPTSQPGHVSGYVYQTPKGTWHGTVSLGGSRGLEPKLWDFYGTEEEVRQQIDAFLTELRRRGILASNRVPRRSDEI